MRKDFQLMHQINGNFQTVNRTLSKKTVLSNHVNQRKENKLF